MDLREEYEEIRQFVIPILYLVEDSIQSSYTLLSILSNTLHT